MTTPGNKLKSRKCTFKIAREAQFRFFNAIYRPTSQGLDYNRTKKVTIEQVLSL